MLNAFVRELQKLAHPVVKNPKDLERLLNPGDILYTKPREVKGAINNVFYAIEKRVQGTPHTHIGMYVGDGRVVDANEWHDGKKMVLKIHENPLKKFTDRYEFRVLRVDTTKDVKKDAVDFVKKQVGKDYNMRGMLRLVLPFQGKASKEDRQRRDEADSFFCSELVANAYADLGIAKKKKLEHVLPSDIANSRLTKTVAEYR